MKIKLNGKIVEFDSNLSVTELISKKDLNPEGVVVELNMEIISKDKRDTTILKEDDVVEILHFVGGG